MKTGIISGDRTHKMRLDTSRHANNWRKEYRNRAKHTTLKNTIKEVDDEMAIPFREQTKALKHMNKTQVEQIQRNK